jgi:hypothetical protein
MLLRAASLRIGADTAIISVDASPPGPEIRVHCRFLCGRFFRWRCLVFDGAFIRRSSLTRDQVGEALPEFAVGHEFIMPPEPPQRARPFNAREPQAQSPGLG